MPDKINKDNLKKSIDDTRRAIDKLKEQIEAKELALQKLEELEIKYNTPFNFGTEYFISSDITLSNNPPIFIGTGFCEPDPHGSALIVSNNWRMEVIENYNGRRNTALKFYPI